MKFRVGKDIYVEDPTPEIGQWVKKNLVLQNPDYYKKQAMGLYTGNTPKEIWLFQMDGGNFRLPFGTFADLWRLHPVEWDWKNEIERNWFRVFDYKSQIKPYDYQESAIQAMLYRKNGVVLMPCGSGKGLPVDAKICTPTGWKRNGDLQVGDAVVGSDGKATRVTGIFDRGKVDAYKITFSDGVETVCDKDHLWTVQKQSQRTESGNWDVMNTQDIYEHYQNMKCRSQYLYIPIVKPVEFYGYEDYRNMNPWLLGFLLGDGCFQKSMITMSTSEDDIREKVVDIIGKEYGACEWITHIKNYDWRFCGGYTLHSIRSLGLGCKHSYEKFIPKEYLFAPVEVRLAVLQGLFDADGHISNGIIYEYSTTSKQLADDVVFIVESLGGTAKVKEKIPTYTYNGEKRTGRKAYRIYFKLYNFKPFTSKKHSAKYRERTYYNKAYRIIKKIEPCEPITSRCITVDAPDQLYVTEHFVVTHNTQTALEAIARIGGRALWLTHTGDLLRQSRKRAESVFGIDKNTFGEITGGKVDIGESITFATVQTMCGTDLAAHQDDWDVVVVDECMPGNTLIDTPKGKKYLQFLHIDDIITSYNRKTGETENKRVTHIFKHKAHDIVKVTLSNGDTIVCTKNHPIYTTPGIWLDAGRLMQNDYVLRLVWKRSRNRCNAEIYEEQSLKKRILLLFQRMLNKRRSQKRCVDRGAQAQGSRNDEKNKQPVSRSVRRTYEKRQSDEKAGSAKGCIGQAKRNRTQAKDKMWKRSRVNSASTNVDDSTGGKSRGLRRISDTNKNAKRQRLSNLLQSGHSNPGRNDSNRGRWQFALCGRTAKTGRKKRPILEWVRVESVEIQKQTSDGTYGGLCADGYVYNIEVEDNNNYFADGILVHNCQHCSGSPTKVTQFYKVVSSLRCRYKFGLTATLHRSDGLERAVTALLGPVIHECDRECVADTTVPIKVEWVDTGYTPDLDEVTQGDGTLDYHKMVDALCEDEKRFDVVFDKITDLDGSAIILANRVEYLQKMCDAYNDGEYGLAVCISGGKQTKAEKIRRKLALEDLNAGTIDCVFATYQLAAEGLDVPNLRYVVMATPEKNERTVIQAAGRVGRTAPGKEYGTVIDFVDDFSMYKGWANKRKRFYDKLGG